MKTHLCVFLSLASVLGVTAATRVWDGGSGSGSYWTIAANWSGNVRPSAGDFLVFPAGASRLKNTNNFSPQTIFGGIIIQGDNYDIYGNAISLTNHLSADPGASANKFRPDLRWLASGFIRARGSGPQLTCYGELDLNGHPVTFNGSGEQHYAGRITGVGNVTKAGSGKLVLSGFQANNYAGDTVVLDGTLELRKYLVLLPSGKKIPRIAVPGNLQIGLNNSSLISDAVVLDASHQLSTDAQVTVNATGELNLNGHNNTILFLRQAGGHVTTGAGSLTVQGNIVCAADADGSVISGRLNLGDSATIVTVQPGARLSLAATVEGGAAGWLTKAGSGELRLENANTYAGPTTLQDGTLALYDPSALGGGNDTLRVEGGTLKLVNVQMLFRHLWVSAAATLAASGGSSTWRGDVRIDPMVVVQTPGSSRLTISGPIAGPGGFRKFGSGSFRLAGTTDNTFSGSCAVHEGVLELSKFLPGHSVVAVPGLLSVGDGLGGLAADVVRYAQADQVADSARVLVSSSGQIYMQDWPDEIGSLSGDGGVNLGTAMLTVGGNGLATSFGGTISGTGSLVKTGNASLTLSGINTYVGATTIDEGTLFVTGQLTDSLPVRVHPGGTLAGSGQVFDVLVSAGGRIAPGASPGNLTVGAVDLSHGTLEIELNGPNPGADYDQLTAAGHVTLGAVLEATANFVPQVGDEFLILNNTGVAPISGPFAGLFEGSRLPVGGQLFRITYHGGDGNDVVLTRLQAPPPELTGMVPLSNGSRKVTGLGLPGLSYLIQAADSLHSPITWTDLGSADADSTGVFAFIDPDAQNHPQRFYRAVAP